MAWRGFTPDFLRPKPLSHAGEPAMHLIWANHDSCEENEVSQISRDVQIGCLTFPTSFIAMLVHRGAEPFGVVQPGNSSQFPQGSPVRDSCRAAFLIAFAVSSCFQKIATRPGCWRLHFRAGRISTVAAADSRFSALSSCRDHRSQIISAGHRSKTGVYYPFFGY